MYKIKCLLGSPHNTVFILQGGLQTLLGYINDKDPDKISINLASSLDTIAQLELLQVIMMSNQFKMIRNLE